MDSPSANIADSASKISFKSTHLSPSPSDPQSPSLPNLLP